MPDQVPMSLGSCGDKRIIRGREIGIGAFGIVNVSAYVTKPTWRLPEITNRLVQVMTPVTQISNIEEK